MSEIVNRGQEIIAKVGKRAFQLVCGGWDPVDFPLDPCLPIIGPFASHTIHYAYIFLTYAVISACYPLGKHFVKHSTRPAAGSQGLGHHALGQVPAFGTALSSALSPAPDSGLGPVENLAVWLLTIIRNRPDTPTSHYH